MQRKDIEKEYIKKIKELKKHNKAYFEENNPFLSDKDYDKIKYQILDLEKKYKFLKNNNSPSKKVGYEPSGKFKKIDLGLTFLTVV